MTFENTMHDKINIQSSVVEASLVIIILTFFQVGIASKYFGPIILSMTALMKDVLLFLSTFTVIMLAFASGVSYIFNMASGTYISVNTVLAIRGCS